MSPGGGTIIGLELPRFAAQRVFSITVLNIRIYLRLTEPGILENGI